MTLLPERIIRFWTISKIIPCLLTLWVGANTHWNLMSMLFVGWVMPMLFIDHFILDYCILTKKVK